MFYIEKNDKPNWLIKKANIIKVEDNTIILPIYEKIKPKGIEKLAKKTNKIIRKNSNSVKAVVSKEIQKEKQYINLLNTYGIEIADGKWHNINKWRLHRRPRNWLTRPNKCIHSTRQIQHRNTRHIQQPKHKRTSK